MINHTAFQLSVLNLTIHDPALESLVEMGGEITYWRVPGQFGGQGMPSVRQRAPFEAVARQERALQRE
jgi:hypothetical protein